MKAPLEWLKEFVPIRVGPEALAKRLTMAGLEVVSIHDLDGQPVLDVEVTPNRPDCLSIVGLAREVAAITGRRLKGLGQGTGHRGQGKPPTRPASRAPRPTIVVEDRKGCPRYIGRLLQGVRVEPSPGWMQRRLLACGARPINNIVDITNYVLFESGQPLHAFDFDRLARGTLLVRRARPSERLTTLDGLTRSLTADMLVIADAEQPVAVAGVMGGAGSEVTPQTTTVLLESALFDPVTVRRTARHLGLASESSSRFERGVDPLGVETASRRAAWLMGELGRGREIAVRDVGTARARRTAIVLETGRLNRWLGTRLDAPTIRSALARLSCRVASSSGSSLMSVAPPSFRRDLAQAVDLYEEIARVIGYDRISPTDPSRAAVVRPPDPAPAYERRQAVKQLCAGLGLTEIISWSLVSADELSRLGWAPGRAARLVNPLSQDHAYMRPTLLAGLVQAVRRNVTQGAAGLALFEVGSVMPSASAQESQRLGVALSGHWLRDWHAREPTDFFRLKGLVERIVRGSCGHAPQFVPNQAAWAERGMSADVILQGRLIGVVGALSLAIRRAADLEPDVWLAELVASELLDAAQPHMRVRPPAACPPVKRDLSCLVDHVTPFEAVDRAIRETVGSLASRIELIDRYQGPQVPPGKSSLTFSIEYRDPARTLTAGEVDDVHQRVAQALASRFGAALR